MRNTTTQYEEGKDRKIFLNMKEKLRDVKDKIGISSIHKIGVSGKKESKK